MTLGDYVKQYADGEIDAIALIRILSGMFNPDHAVSLLAIINFITRIEHGDADRQLLLDLYGPKDDTQDEQN